MSHTRKSINDFEAEQKEAVELFCKDLRVALSDGSPFKMSEAELAEFRASALHYAYLHQQQIAHALRTAFVEVQEQMFPGNPTPWLEKSEEEVRAEKEGRVRKIREDGEIEIITFAQFFKEIFES